MSYPCLVTQKPTSGKDKASAGLCADCRYARRIESERGSQFILCERSATDASFPKYPRLPILACSGYVPIGKARGLKTAARDELL